MSEEHVEFEQPIISNRGSKSSELKNSEEYRFFEESKRNLTSSLYKKNKYSNDLVDGKYFVSPQGKKTQNFLGAPPINYSDGNEENIFEIISEQKERKNSDGKNTAVSESYKFGNGLMGTNEKNPNAFKQIPGQMYQSVNFLSPALKSVENIATTNSKSIYKKKGRIRENSWDNFKSIVIPEEVVIPRSKTSSMKVGPICGYSVNSFNNITGKIYQDRVAMYINLIDFKDKKINFAFFGLYTGYRGSLCANFLRDNFHKYLIKNEDFPYNIHKSVESSLAKCEKDFLELRDLSSNTEKRYNQNAKNNGNSFSSASAKMLLILGKNAY